MGRSVPEGPPSKLERAVNGGDRVSKLPAGWSFPTLGEVAGEKQNLVIGPFGSDLRTSDYTSQGVPLIFVRDIRAADFSHPRQFVSPEKASSLAAHVALPGDVLVTKMGDPPGDACVYTGTHPAIITADCIRLRPSADFDARFVARAFASPDVQRQVAAITSGVAQRKVSLSRFRTGIAIPAPPLDEQRRIVNILEGHLFRLDAADATLHHGVGLLAALEVRALADIHTGLARPLSSVAQIQGGIQKQPQRHPVANMYPFLRVANVTAHGLDIHEVHKIELFPGEIDRYRLKAGDLLVVEGNGSPDQVGRAVLWDGAIPDTVHQNHLIRVRPGADLIPDYLEAVWNSPQTRRTLSDLSSSSSGLHTLSVSKLASLEIPIPSREIQARCVEQVRTIRDSTARMKLRLSTMVDRSFSLRRTLLAAAFSGRLSGHWSDRDRADGLELT